jgi:hypothetical protein
MNLKKHYFPKDSFIQGWYIPEKICDDLINYYNKNKHKTSSGKCFIKGELVNNNDHKQSIDLSLGRDNFDKGVAGYRVYLQEVLNLYMGEYPEVNQLPRFDVEDINIQWYPKNGGFKKWHYERGDAFNFSRNLVFMTYLNDIENGGTHFKYQNLTSPAKKGLTLIWPPDWTHTHKGQIVDKEKFIATGWYRLI